MLLRSKPSEPDRITPARQSQKWFVINFDDDKFVEKKANIAPMQFRTAKKEIKMPSIDDVKADKIKNNISDLEKAVNEVSKKLGIIPKECEWGCEVEIGPDGKPRLVCGIRC